MKILRFSDVFRDYRNVTIGKNRLRTRIFIPELNSSLTVLLYTLTKKIFEKFGFLKTLQIKVVSRSKVS